MQSPVQIVPLFDKIAINAPDANDVFIPLDSDSFADWGPRLSEITVHTDTTEAGPNIEWAVVIYHSYDGVTWSTTPADLFTAISANGQVAHSPFTDRSKFGLRIRLAIRFKSTSGASSARVSATAAFRFLS